MPGSWWWGSRDIMCQTRLSLTAEGPSHPTPLIKSVLATRATWGRTLFKISSSSEHNPSGHTLHTCADLQCHHPSRDLFITLMAQAPTFLYHNWARVSIRGSTCPSLQWYMRWSRGTSELIRTNDTGVEEQVCEGRQCAVIWGREGRSLWKQK